MSCLEDHPTTKTVRLGGRFISLAKIEKETGLDHGYTSYIFSGKRTPSVPYAIKLAKALGMSIDDLLYAIAERQDDLEKKFREQLAS
jgi:transcriptional regulator with XRE-family HTH domain